MKRKLAYLGMGIVFGFTLSRVGASQYDLIYTMFTGEDLTLAWVIITAIVTGFIGLRVLAATGGRTFDGKPITISKKPLGWTNAAGGAVFGVGWGMAGACPGTVLAQLGEGKVLAVFTLLGILAGTFLYALLVERFPSLDLEQAHAAGATRSKREGA
ncbi:MAG: YeeE/YedE thiosulfate transporter family protein [Syntrophomonadaceae bacterium]|jgi:uncharacterized membrane protein YedE/YeeE|nr:YeeE/YedE family protein [Syntrophomonadaceae bacterium]MDH7497702.1 YeeE/YedE thiosulfate transporter family protein [Syntrophomonadaceae bacterium]